MTLDERIEIQECLSNENNRNDITSDDQTGKKCTAQSQTRLMRLQPCGAAFYFPPDIASSIFSMNIPYPTAGSLTITWVTAPISRPFWIIGEPLMAVSI